MLFSVQVHGVCPEVHSYAYWGAGVNIGWKSHICQPSAIIVCTAISCCQILADNILWSIKKTQFAISTICQCCLHTKQHTHLCSAAAPLQSHSERGWADAVSSISKLQRTSVCVRESASVQSQSHFYTDCQQTTHRVLEEQQWLFGDFISSCHI